MLPLSSTHSRTTPQALPALGQVIVCVVWIVGLALPLLGASSASAQTRAAQTTSARTTTAQKATRKKTKRRRKKRRRRRKRPNNTDQVYFRLSAFSPTTCVSSDLCPSGAALDPEWTFLSGDVSLGIRGDENMTLELRGYINAFNAEQRSNAPARGVGGGWVLGSKYHFQNSARWDPYLGACLGISSAEIFKGDAPQQALGPTMLLVAGGDYFLSRHTAFGLETNAQLILGTLEDQASYGVLWAIRWHFIFYFTDAPNFDRFDMSR